MRKFLHYIRSQDGLLQEAYADYIRLEDLELVRPATLTPGLWYGPFVIDQLGRVIAAYGESGVGSTYSVSDPFDPWDGAGAPSPTTVYPFMVTCLFQGAGGEAQTLNIVGSAGNIVPGTLVGSTGLLSGGTVPTGVYNAPAAGTTAWGLYPGAWYVGFTTAATADRFSMVSPAGTIENPDNAAWHDYALINVLADGTVICDGTPSRHGFSIVALVPP